MTLVKRVKHWRQASPVGCVSSNRLVRGILPQTPRRAHARQARGNAAWRSCVEDDGFCWIGSPGTAEKTLPHTWDSVIGIGKIHIILSTTRFWWPGP